MHTHTRGFTLMEVVTVVAIIISISTVLVLNGATSRSITKLDTAARQLKSLILEAQAYGGSGREYPAGDLSADRFDKGYGVYVTSSGANDRAILYGGLGVSSAKPDSSYDTTSGTNKVETVAFPSGVTVSRIHLCVGAVCTDNTQGHIHFKRGLSKVLIWDNTETLKTSVTITLGVGSFTKQVTVNEYGLVEVQ